MITLPYEFTERMKALLGEEYEDFYAEFNKPNIKAYRVNTVKAKQGLKDNPFGSEKIPYTENGYYLTYNKAGTHPYHHCGAVYIQEPAAMMPCECVDINPSWAVLDLCAAPGGKSTRVAEALENGFLVSNEISTSRCKVLMSNIERMGIKNSVILNCDSSKVASLFPNAFDLIIVDAPCSGEGMFRKEQAAIDDWSVENSFSCALRQRQILDNAVKCLKAGGIIIYSTCTYSLCENEETVDYFLNNHPDFILQMPNERVMEYSSPGVRFNGCKAENIEYCRRLYPHKNRGEGQFAAVLKNTLPKTEGISHPKAKGDKLPAVVTDFLKDTLLSFNDNCFYINGDKVSYFEPDFNFDKSKVYSFGVTVGEIKKNYFLPHHQFFSCFGSGFKRKLDFSPSDKSLLAYLMGETVECDLENGWAAVTVNGIPLGGIKVTNGVGKNHYPKGLRNLNKN